MNRRDELEEITSIMREVINADYNYSRNFRNFLETSNTYFSNSAFNVRQMYSTLNRIISQQTQRNFSLFSNSTSTPFPNTTTPFPNTTGQRFNQPSANTQQRRNSFRHRNLHNENRNQTTTRSNNNLNNLFNTLTNSILISNQERVIPTEQDISNNCTQIVFRDCSSNQFMCPIDRIEFELEDQILRINHCGHIFREQNLRRVFQQESRCPLCRYNILTNSSLETLRENEQRQRVTDTLQNAFNGIPNTSINLPDTVSHSDSFVDGSGNNISIEYVVSSNFSG